MKKGAALVLLLFICGFVQARQNNIRKKYDVLAYDISLKVVPEKKWIEGNNKIRLLAVGNFKEIELDLFWQLRISQIEFEGKSLEYTRDSFSFLFTLPRAIKKGDVCEFTVHYEGMPQVAKKAPWDGGFVWSKDSLGKPWVGLACEGLGASCWLPCKDGWEDEPEKVKVRIAVPPGLTGVSNGRLMNRKVRADGYHEFEWQVVSPINHYNISVNVGNYTLLEDLYLNEWGSRLDLNYYVLSYHVSEAKTHFQQVKRMLASMEKYFGPYPFYTDGYKLVETPYWGMEHQSCVAYGNNFQNNKFGFDFIIVHESGHEWFANSITAKDKSDMWIHEGFTTYSEALYVEKMYGESRAAQYLAGQKSLIKNASPVIGPRGINYNRPDNDIYYKAAWMLHTMRTMLDNDTLWFNTLRDINKKYYHSIITSSELENYISQRTGYDFRPFFRQYLYHAALPRIEYYLVQKNDLNELHYRLVSDVKKLEMPVKVTLSKGKYEYLQVDSKWRIIDLPYSDSEDFKLDDKHFLLEFKKITPQKAKGL